MISRILRVEGSSFLSKCSKLDLHFRNAIKDREKAFRFWDNCVWIFCGKSCILRREYWYPAVNVLTNSSKIWDLTKTDFFQLNLSQIYAKNSIIVMPFWFEQCFEDANTLFTETCSEVCPFRHLSNHLLSASNSRNTSSRRLILCLKMF